MKIHQIKSNWYYIFWGIMSIAVVSGQIYVGLGYRKMAEATKLSRIEVICLPEYVTPQPQKYNKTLEFE